MSNGRQKIIVIVGPTASGKSALAVKIAKKYNGEIISADSRQVYRGLTIGTAKISDGEKQSIKHHLLDVADPARQFSAAEFVEQAQRAVSDIAKRGKTPIITGGTAFWIDALVYGMELPRVAPNAALRKKLEQKTPAALLALLKKCDPQRAAEIEQKNPHRLIRAIEIARALGRVPKLKKGSPYAALWIGIRPAAAMLERRILVRAEEMVRRGFANEVRRLLQKRVSKKRIRELGFEYRAGLEYVSGALTRRDLAGRITRDTKKYARRQMTWWKRNNRIHWTADSTSKSPLTLVRKFLSARAAGAR